MWLEDRLHRETPFVQAGDHHTLSYTTTANHVNRNRVAAVRGKVHCPQHYFCWQLKAPTYDQRNGSSKSESAVYKPEVKYK